MVIIKRADAEDIRSKAHCGRKIVSKKKADAEDIRSRAHKERKTAIKERTERIYDQRLTERGKW